MAAPSTKELIQALEIRLERIEAQLGLKPPRPSKSLRERFKEWASANPWTSIPLSIALTGFSVFFGYWLSHHTEWRDQDVDKRVEVVLDKPDGVQQTLNQLKVTVERLDEKLKTLEPFIHDVIEHQFENASKLPAQALIPRIPALNNLAAVATNQKVAVNPKLVSEVGIKLVDASRQNVVAWPTVLRWMDYKSFNNSFSSALPDTTIEPEFKDKYLVNVPTGGIHPKFLLKGVAPANVAAQTGYIQQGDRNEGMKVGPAWIIAEGGEVGLDNLNLRNVVFHHVQITYHGLPVIMKNVYFVDCTFNMKVDAKAQDLAIALLGPTPSTSFRN